MQGKIGQSTLFQAINTLNKVRAKLWLCGIIYVTLCKGTVQQIWWHLKSVTDTKRPSMSLQYLMLFLYWDDGSHLYTIIYRIKWQMTWFPFEGGRLIQVKITKKDKHGTAIGWPRPRNRGGRLTQVTNTAFVWKKNRDFENWPLDRGPFNIQGCVPFHCLEGISILPACYFENGRNL